MNLAEPSIGDQRECLLHRSAKRWKASRETSWLGPLRRCFPPTSSLPVQAFGLERLDDVRSVLAVCADHGSSAMSRPFTTPM
jgi:hypothetical protein